MPEKPGPQPPDGIEEAGTHMGEEADDLSLDVAKTGRIVKFENRDAYDTNFIAAYRNIFSRGLKDAMNG